MRFCNLLSFHKSGQETRMPFDDDDDVVLLVVKK